MLGLVARRATALLLCVALPGTALGQAPATAGSSEDPAAQAAESRFKAGQYAEARSAYEALVRKAPTVSRYWYQLGLTCANMKNYERAAEAFERAAGIDQSPRSQYNAGAMHARLGRRDRAFEWLGKAAPTGFISLDLLKTDTDLDPLRSDPRFAALQATAEKAFTPCGSDPEAHRFDFWVGEWEVKTAQGQIAGRSRIEPVSGQCGLLENWTDARGATGKSLNAYNRALKHWQQFWVGQFGEVTEYRGSEWREGSLVFSARATQPGGSPRLLRMTFTPVSSEVVRQFGEQSVDDGKTWTTRFDLYYHRRK
jgi:tetratricopeptide (TPR) repeat protein